MSDTIRLSCKLEDFSGIWDFDVCISLVVTCDDLLEQSEMTQLRSYGMNVSDTFEGV